MSGHQESIATERWWRLRSATAEIGGALAFYLALAIALTWPAAPNLWDVLVGGGELGGWRWRQWWHFQEVEALAASALGPIDRVAALLSLGRYPETGNILDILLLSYPLDGWLGFPADHNAKVLAILTGNGICAYALARTFTDSRLAAAAAGTLALFNPLVIQDINKTGLRQVLLWWLLLFPITVQRAQRTCAPRDGLMVGACFTAVAAFYWFYGLFAAMVGAIIVGAWLLRERPPAALALRWLGPAALVAVLGSLVFVSPYLSSGGGGSGGGLPRLPELTFGLAFPSYDTIAAAPLRPSSYQENILSSLHRTIDSSWAADYVVNPGHGVLALPVAAFFLGVLPATFLRKARAWLVVWWLFFLGTLGPFLKIGAQQDTSEVITLGAYVVRLPYALMFQVIPGMSRMFAPYRLAGVVVVASVVLLAISLDAFRGWRRTLALTAALLTIPVQLFYRFDLGPVAEGSAGPAMWRIPTQLGAFRLPEWYAELDPEGWEGLIELPLEQQQDILCAYQSFHRRKVYRSWASNSALPPSLRVEGGGPTGERLRWLARPEPAPDDAEAFLLELSRAPLDTDPAALEDAALEALVERGDYRWLVIHERGYYLVDPEQGGTLYRHALRLMTERLDLQPRQLAEHESFEWPGKTRHFPVGPAWVPWASREVHLPTPQLPSRFFMAVFDLHAWKAAPPADG